MDGVQALDVPQAAIAAPSGGTVSDLSARQTIGEIIAVLQHHGLILSPA
jgi:K+/H+ antiporter YhaU regulatory subunit KhtT